MQSSTSIYKSMQLSPTRLFAMIFILEKAPFIITKKFTTKKNSKARHFWWPSYFWRPIKTVLKSASRDSDMQN